MQETEAMLIDEIPSAELAEEAERWGAADWCVGGRLADCPYATDDWLAYHWRLGYTQRERMATRLERAIAATARLLRTRLWGRPDERGAQ